MIGCVTSFFIVFSSFFGGSAVVLVDPDRQEIVFVLWAFAHVYIFLRKRSPTSVRPASAARDRQSQSNLFRPDLFCLSVSICNLKEKMFALCASQIVDFLVRFADFARTCEVIANVSELPGSGLRTSRSAGIYLQPSPQSAWCILGTHVFAPS